MEGQDGLTDRTPYRYCGEYHDTETGSVYLRARMYDPRIGRFRTEDPASSGMNWYIYCGNNPVMFIDPKGLSSILDRIAEGQKRKAADEALLDKYRTLSRKQKIANDKKTMENRDSGTPYSYKASKLDPWSLEQQQVRDAYQMDWSGTYRSTLNGEEYIGVNVDYEFKLKTMLIANDLGIYPDDLMTLMAVESKIATRKSPYGNRGGLLQFVKPTAESMGYTLPEIYAMDALQQLDVVHKFFNMVLTTYKEADRTNIIDLYTLMLLPSAGGFGQDDSFTVLPVTSIYYACLLYTSRCV